MIDDVAESGDIWLGLDLGTQSARAMAVSARGEVQRLAARELTDAAAMAVRRPILDRSGA